MIGNARQVRVVGPEDVRPERLEDLLAEVTRGDQNAYEVLYHRVAAPVYGLVLRVLRDPAQSEEVTQEVLLTIWRESSRFDHKQGIAMAWIMTIAHRRAVDRVPSEQATANRRQRSRSTADKTSRHRGTNTPRGCHV